MSTLHITARFWATIELLPDGIPEVVEGPDTVRLPVESMRAIVFGEREAA